MEFMGFAWNVLCHLQTRFQEEVHCLEQMFIRMNCFYNFICQLFFFIMTAIALSDTSSSSTNAAQKTFKQTIPQGTRLKKDERIVNGLSTLLFYSVLGYFFSRIRDVYWRNYAHNSTHTMRNYIKWICRIVIEWTKAIIIVVCLREQGLNMKPQLCYNAITLLYYVATEKVFLHTVSRFVASFNWQTFDSLEHLYIPIALYMYTIVTGSLVCSYLLITPYAKYAVFASYFLVYIRIKDMTYNYLKVLNLEKQTFASFRTATERDLKNWDDICAVCLNSMSRAKITPCNHFFHPLCLKQCLQTSYQCPLCKQDFLDYVAQ